MASALSLASVAFELSTPIEQLECLIKSSDNELFVQTSEKIQSYLQDGKKIEEAMAAIYVYYDTKLLFTITHRLDKTTQEKLREDIQILLGNLYGAQHPETLSKYEATEVDVRVSLRELGERMRILVLATYEKNQEEAFLKIEDEKEMFY